MPDSKSTAAMPTSLPAALPTSLSSHGHLFRPVVVLGAWSSGTTACVSLFEQLGYWSCPPHHLTNDPRTPNAREPKFLRHMIMRHFDESTLQRRQDNPAEVIHNLKFLYQGFAFEAGRHWKRGLVMKLPHLCFFVPELHQAFDPRFIVMTRDLEQIERTRERRDWDASMGKWGAEQCLARMTTDLDALGLDYLDVAFEDLVGDTRGQLARLEAFLDTTFSPADIDRALGAVIRR